MGAKRVGVCDPRSPRYLLSCVALLIAVTLFATPAVAVTPMSARQYGTWLFDRTPLPPSAARLATPEIPLQPVTGSPSFAHVTRVTRYYVVSGTVNVGTFAKSHWASNEWQGTGTSNDGRPRTSNTFAGMAMCPDRHAAYCSATYTTTRLSSTRQELRVDVDLVWTAIRTVYMPTSGVVTVTGYQTLSLMNASSGPVTVTLNGSQVQRLRTAISQLRASPGGMCMEDATLFKISVASTKGTAARWSAVADECPGVLAVSFKGTHVALNDRSCALESLVSTFFTAPQARGTTTALKSCTP